MSVSQMLYDVFKEDSSGPLPFKMFPDEAEEGAVAPYAVYTIIGGDEVMHMRGSGNAWAKVVQIDTYYRRGLSGRFQADEMMGLVRERMLAATTFRVTAIEESGAPRYDTESKLHRASLEFTIRYP